MSSIFVLSPGSHDAAFTNMAWTLARIVAILLFILLAQILFLRLLLARRRRRLDVFRAVWEPLLATAADAFPARLPVLRRREVSAFLLIWNYLQETLRDQAKERLNRVARRLDIDRSVMRMIRKAGVRDRLIALTAAGHLGDATLWDEMLRIAAEDETVLSLSAAKALMRIDAARAAPVVIPLVARRTDWPAANVAAMLGEAGPAAVSAALAAAADAADPDVAPRLIRLLDLAHTDDAAPVIRRYLESNDDTETVTACLRVVQDPELLELVRDRLQDERWQVRLHAAQALGRLGTREDEWHLRRALADSQWWVRYRAAQALGNLPFMDVDRLRRITEDVEDRYGRDILRQVIAEKELAC
jgi:HEAT repeat protein